MATSSKEREKKIFQISLIGIIANIILSAVKASIGLLSGSIAIIMDSVNNLTDAISSIITVVGISLAGRDPDKKHPFGHGRTEYLSTLIISIIILYAGLTACVESVKNIIKPIVPEYETIMLALLLLAVIVKLFLGWLFTKKGKETKSDSLSASGKDALFDAIISFSTIVAAIIYLTSRISIEAYLGVVISIIILKSGIEILKETVSKILGEGADVQLVKDVKKTILRHEGIRGAYDLVFHNYGQDKYIASVHIEVADTLDANEIDIISRHVAKDVYESHGVILSAIGIYSHNTSDDDVILLREKVERIALSHEFVNQVHGFYLNKKDMVIRFDMVISFDAKSRAQLYEHVLKDLTEEFPDYEISAGMDTDFNEI